MTVHPFHRMRRRLAAVATSLIAAGAAQAEPPPVVTILGDSIAAGLGLSAAQALPAQLESALRRNGVVAVVRGAGVSGDTSAGGLARVDFSVAADTAVCVVELGANDYLQSIPPETTRSDLIAIVRRLKARRIGVVLVGAPRPGRASGTYGREFAAVFPSVAAAEHVRLAPDFLAGVESAPGLKQADGIHPNAAGVVRIAGKLATTVALELRQTRRPPSRQPR